MNFLVRKSEADVLGPGFGEVGAPGDAREARFDRLEET